MTLLSIENAITGFLSTPIGAGYILGVLTVLIIAFLKKVL